MKQICDIKLVINPWSGCLGTNTAYGHKRTVITIIQAKNFELSKYSSPNIFQKYILYKTS